MHYFGVIAETEINVRGVITTVLEDDGAGEGFGSSNTSVGRRKRERTPNGDVSFRGKREGEV